MNEYQIRLIVGSIFVFVAYFIDIILGSKEKLPIASSMFGLGLGMIVYTIITLNALN